MRRITNADRKAIEGFRAGKVNTVYGKENDR